MTALVKHQFCDAPACAILAYRRHDAEAGLPHKIEYRRLCPPFSGAGAVRAESFSDS